MSVLEWPPLSDSTLREGKLHSYQLQQKNLYSFNDPVIAPSHFLLWRLITALIGHFGDYAVALLFYRA